MSRKRIGKAEEQEGGAYFNAPLSSIETFSSGCMLLDCVLGGGWAEGRMANIVGESGGGKSLLAIEASANFLRKHADGKVYYVETEQAFDPEYTASLGIPVDRINLRDDLFTVEDVFRDLESKLAESSEGPSTLYIIDSLDALSDEAEVRRDIAEGTYGANKAKQLSALFRKLHAKLGKAKITVIVISQVRDNIGVTFGEKHTRSGGRALTFYCSQVLWLAYTGKIKQAVKGIENTIGVKIRAKTKKNRIGPPFRECDFNILFNYGVDDLQANIDFLLKVKQLDCLDGFEGLDVAKVKAKLRRMSVDDLIKLSDEAASAVQRVWCEIEDSFKPRMKKYT